MRTGCSLCQSLWTFRWVSVPATSVMECRLPDAALWNAFESEATSSSPPRFNRSEVPTVEFNP